MHSLRFSIVHLGTIGSLALGLCACPVTTIRLNQDHCGNNEGDQYCAENFPDTPLCEIGSGECTLGGRTGCVAEVTDECHDPCGVNRDDCMLGEDSSSGDGEESTTGEMSTSTTDDPTGTTTTGPMPCVGDEECTDDAAPFCGAEGECVACDGVADGDAACAELDAMAPLCVEAECVACTGDDTSVCDAQLLLCDQGTNACAPCTEHQQCDSGACELDEGTCFDPISVVHVDGDGGLDFTSVTEAVASIEAGQLGVIVVHELDGAGSYQGAVTIDGGKTLALIAAEGEAPIIQGTGGNPGLNITGGDTTVYIDGINLVGNTSAEGLVVDAATVTVQRSRIVQNSGGGIVANNGAVLTVENCFVGDGTNPANAVTVDAATLDIVYSTFGTGFDNFESVFALSCTSPVAVTVRNSLLFSLDNESSEVACDGAILSFNAAETMLPGTDNTMLNELQADWFVNVNGGDFTLDVPPKGLSTAAEWQDGDPPADIDGDPRPATNGSPDYAGADVPL